MRDTGGDKDTGNKLVKEVLKLQQEEQRNRPDQQNRLRQEDRTRTDSRDQQLRLRQEERARTDAREQEFKQRQEERTKSESRDQESRKLSDRKQQPPSGMLSDFGGGKWQRDESGNFVTRTKDGRLLTPDGNGKLVDYQSFLNQKHMASQDQMAFASILFCNPLMLFGMGTALTLMENSHQRNSQRSVERVNKAFDGKQANAQAMRTGYAGDLNHKAALIAQYTRPIAGSEASQMNGLAGMTRRQSAEVESEIKRKKRIDDRAKRAETKVSMPSDRYNLSRQKLQKTKLLIEEHIEKVRGKASLEEMSKLYSQVEVLDKALKRMSNF